MCSVFTIVIIHKSVKYELNWQNKMALFPSRTRIGVMLCTGAIPQAEPCPRNTALIPNSRTQLPPTLVLPSTLKWAT